MRAEYFPTLEQAVVDSLPIVEAKQGVLFLQREGTNVRKVKLYYVSPEGFNKAKEVLTGQTVGTEPALKGKKVFVLPNCSIPAYKVNDYLKSREAKLVRSYHKADVIIGNSNTSYIDNYGRGNINQYLMSLPSSYVGKVKPEEAEKAYLSLKDDVTALQPKRTAREIPWATVISDPLNFVTTYDLCYAVGSARYDDALNDVQYPKDKSFNGNFITPLGVELLSTIQANSIPVYNDSCINSFLDSVVTIDEESYNTLVSMFESSDDGNWTLASEMLANSHVNNSLFWIYRLSQNPQIVVRLQHKYKNIRLFIDSVNWHSIRNYTPSAMAHLMKNRGLLTKDMFDWFMKENAKVLQEQLGENSLVDIMFLPKPEYSTFLTPTENYQVVHRLDMEDIGEDSEVEEEEEVEDDSPF